MADFPKVLLLAGFPPEGGGGGGVTLRSVLDKFPAGRLAWLSLQADVSTAWTWRPDLRRSSVARRVPGRRFRPVRAAWEHILYRWEASEALQLADRIKQEWTPDCVWAILDHQTLWAAYEIVRKLSLPWHVSVHDDPALSRRLLGTRLPEEWSRRFEYLYCNAQSRDCISVGMTKYYEARFGVSAFMISRTIDPTEMARSRQRRLFQNEVIQIVMGGWGDCPDPWPGNLIEAVSLLQRSLSRPVRLHALDPALKRYESESVTVPNRMSQTDFEAFVRTMDLGYAPDPLTSGAAREFVQTSLPTKLVTYLGATIPALYHGPSDSTVGEMFSRFKAGEIVPSQSAEVLAKGFRRLIEDPEPYRDNAVELAKADFDPDTLMQRIRGRF